MAERVADFIGAFLGVVLGARSRFDFVGEVGISHGSFPNGRNGGDDEMATLIICHFGSKRA